MGHTEGCVAMGTQGEYSYGHTEGSVAMGTQGECSYGHTEGSVFMAPLLLNLSTSRYKWSA